jgi:glycogen debranching enzyme
VQGYVYAAYLAMAALSKRRGQAATSVDWRRRAERLRTRVEHAFWMEDRGFYGLALDGEGRLCRVSASNAGHLLFCGLPSPARAAKVKDRLLSPAFNSGWGLRTLAVGEARYNPMSYHNGSVWPHDNAICVAGIARYGHKKAAVSLLNQAFEAAVHFDMEVPELFCGFSRAPSEPPIGYPVACMPQAWSAGSVFMILQACLGVRIDSWNREVHISHPILPAGVERLSFRHIPVGPSSVNLTFQQVGGRVVAFTDQEDGPDSVRVLMQM